MTDKESHDKLEKIKKDNVQREYRKSLKKEKVKYKTKPKIETSKLIAIYLFILLNTIIIYAMIAMWVFTDFTYLGVLISDIAAQVVVYAVYCMKAYKAKRSEEELKFEREKFSGSLGEVLSAGTNGEECVSINGNIEECVHG